MLVNCKNCQKKFVVPDSAITESGRLVQCGSCANTWTQYPTEEKQLGEAEIIKNTNLKETRAVKSKNIIKKTRPKKNLYTAEYLKKKHGIIINKANDNPTKKVLEKKINFGFYSYLIILFVFLISLFGILELTKEIIIMQYPSLETYIDYFYEVINIVKLSLTEFLN